MCHICRALILEGPSNGTKSNDAASTGGRLQIGRCQSGFRYAYSAGVRLPGFDLAVWSSAKGHQQRNERINMTTRPTEPIRTEHRGLIPDVEAVDRAAIELAQWNQEAASDRLFHIIDFLEGQLLPHAAAEESVMYPAIDEAMGAAIATATMRVDHDEIASRVKHLRETITKALDVWPDAERAAAVARQLSALAAIILLHFRKEEEVLLPILDSKLTVDEAEALFEAMDSEHAHHS